VTRTPQTTPEELRETFAAAQDAFKTWKETSLFSRQNILFKCAPVVYSTPSRSPR
jgi:acyl-CoA reductase-like NAD-dependent aldehyde dehydrogenase